MIALRKIVFIPSKQQGIYIFYVKEDMACESSSLVNGVICSTCNKKYIEETREGKTWVLDKVRVR